MNAHRTSLSPRPLRTPTVQPVVARSYLLTGRLLVAAAKPAELRAFLRIDPTVAGRIVAPRPRTPLDAAG